MIVIFECVILCGIVFIPLLLAYLNPTRQRTSSNIQCIFCFSKQFVHHWLIIAVMLFFFVVGIAFEVVVVVWFLTRSMFSESQSFVDFFSDIHFRSLILNTPPNQKPGSTKDNKCTNSVNVSLSWNISFWYHLCWASNLGSWLLWDTIKTIRHQSTTQNASEQFSRDCWDLCLLCWNGCGCGCGCHICRLVIICNLLIGMEWYLSWIVVGLLT